MSVHVSSVVKVGWSLVRDLLRVPRYQNAKPDATVLSGPGTDMVKVNKMLGKTRQTSCFFSFWGLWGLVSGTKSTVKSCLWGKCHWRRWSEAGNWRLWLVMASLSFCCHLTQSSYFTNPEIGNFSASDSLRPCRLWSDHQSSNFPSFAQRMWCFVYICQVHICREVCADLIALRLLLYVTHIQTMRELWDLLREPVRRTELGDWDPEDLEEPRKQPRSAETTHVVVVWCMTWQ